MRWENVWLDGTPGLSRKKKRRMMKVELYNKGQFWFCVEVWIFAPWHIQALPMVALRAWIHWPWPGRSWVDPLVVSRVMSPWMGPWGSSLGWHCGQGSGTAGRGLAQHLGSSRRRSVFSGWRCRSRSPVGFQGGFALGANPGLFGCVGVSSIASGLGCPVLAPIAPHTSAGLGSASWRAAPCGKKIRDLGKPLWCGEKGLWEGVTCPQKVPSPVIPTCGFVDMLETLGRPRKDGGFGICCRPPLCRQPGDGQGIVIPEHWSVFLQQSHGHCRVPGSTRGMCKMLGVLLSLFTAQIPGTGRDRARGLL